MGHAVHSAEAVPVGYCHVPLPLAFLRRRLVVTPGLPCAVCSRTAAPEPGPPGRRSLRQVRKRRSTGLDAPKATPFRKSLRAREVHSECVRVGVRGASPQQAFHSISLLLLDPLHPASPRRAGEHSAVLSSREEQIAATQTGSGWQGCRHKELPRVLLWV